MSETEPVLIDFGDVLASPRPSVGGACEMGVHSEIVRVCDEESSGVLVLDPKWCVTAGGGDGVVCLEFTMGGESGSAMFWW
jgi:hypothetical protein